jgi:glutamate racemase
MSGAPVGIFDSGVGGLSVAKEIRALLPGEDLLYLADTAYCPYGGRPMDEIRARSVAAVAALVESGVKAVVVACNTASGAALELLREEFSIPILGLEPAVKPAAQNSPTGRIGVMATAGTLASGRFKRLVDNYAQGVDVHAVACPGLVELVEAGETDGGPAIEVLSRLLAPLREAEVDTVVLGCTHYPFLRDAVARVMGPDVRLLDSGRAVANHLKRVLGERDSLADGGRGDFRLLTTGNPASVAVVVRRLWGDDVPVEYLPLAED